MNCDGNFKYPTLTKVAKAILTIPHSNADSERVFSIVKKNAKDTRTSMKVETLSHLMQVKMRMLAEKKCCHERTFSNDFFKEAKSATVNFLKKTCEEEDEHDVCQLGVISV